MKLNTREFCKSLSLTAAGLFVPELYAQDVVPFKRRIKASAAFFSPRPVSYTPLNDSTGVLSDGDVADLIVPSRAFTAPGTYVVSGTGTGNIAPCADYRAFSDCITSNNIRKIYTTDATVQFAANQVFSVCAWFNKDGTGCAANSGAGALMSNYVAGTSGFTLQLTSAVLNMYAFDGGGTLQNANSGVTANDNVWHFVAGGWDGSHLWISVDAAAKVTTAMATLKAAPNNYVLGAYAANVYPIYGRLGGCGLWFTDLSAGNLTTLYNGGLGLAATNFG